MNATSAIIRHLLEQEPDDDFTVKDAVWSPDVHPHPSGRKYGLQMLYGDWKLNWHDYKDGSRIVSAYYWAPTLFWRKHRSGEKTLYWKKSWITADTVKLPSGFDWEAWLSKVEPILANPPPKLHGGSIPKLPKYE